MPHSDTFTFDFRRAAAQQFGERPTLRQVVSQQLLKLLLAELPWLAYVQPGLPSADALALESPAPGLSYWTTQPLVDQVLQAMLETGSLDLEPLGERHYNLGLSEPYRFAGAKSQFESRQISGLTGPLNALIEQLPQHFCEAQLDFWRGQGRTGTSRDQWLQLLLKTALLRGLPLQGLDAQEQACIRGLIRGGADQPNVSFVQARLSKGENHSDEMLNHLLVTGEWDERQVVLWCAPSGQVHSFASLAEFALALRDDLARHYSFDDMTWQRYPVEGNAFAQQVAQLLESVFDRVARVRYGRLADVAALEKLFAELSDPAQWFVTYLDDTSAVTPPPGVSARSGSGAIACHGALLQLAIDQLDAEGVGALDGVQSLHTYARQRLSEQMLKAHADDTSPDDLVLEFYLAQGVPGGAGVGAGGGEPLALEGEKTLTEFAIGNLSALSQASVIRIRHARGAQVPEWLDANAARRLVTQVDIGGTYPRYVAGLLDDPLTREQRVKRFGREWRSTLRFSALQGKLDGKLTETGLQCVMTFCAGHDDPETPRMVLMPLTFRRQPGSHRFDRVRGMYLLFCVEPALVLLYRPLFKQDTLREYASLSALLEHIQDSSLLQASILEWLEPEVRHIYDNGGFREPHVSSVGIDPYSLPEPVVAPVIHPQFWRTGLDDKLYSANRDLLVEMADLQSTSNVERRWETLCQGAWLLFDVVTLVLRGPVASVAWLVQLLASLQNDLLALEQGGEFDRSAAIADLLMNLGMVLMHARQPGLKPGTYGQLPDLANFESVSMQRGAFAEVSVTPTGGVPQAIGTLAALPERRLDLSWRGNHGFNWLPPTQRQALRAMRSGVHFEASDLQTQGQAAGLYRVQGQLYAVMGGDAYPVDVSVGGVRVLDGKGGHGPWLINRDGGWRVDGTLRLAGGMRQGGMREKLAERFNKLVHAINQHVDQVNEVTERYTGLQGEVKALQSKTAKLKALRDKEQLKLDTAHAEDDMGASARLVEQYDARLADWTLQLADKREAAVRCLEEIVRYDSEKLANLETMLEPKFTAQRRKGWDAQLATQKRTALINQIANNDFIIHELWHLAEYPQLVAIQDAVNGRPLLQVHEEYLAYRRKLESVVAFEDRILLAHELLDAAVVEAPGEWVISSEGEAVVRTVDSLIAKRTFSTVQYRFHQALNFAGLALHADSVSGQRSIRMFKEELAGRALRNAAGAHGTLDFANLPVEDRITILQDAWDRYAEALLNSARIRKEGGALIEVAMIDRYRTELEKLKRDAGSRLVEAFKEQDGVSAPPRRLAYLPSSKPQFVVRNVEGQLLIGNVLSEGGRRVLEVSEPFGGKALAHFEWEAGKWRERNQQQAQADAEPVDTADRVQALLDENERLIRKADEYIGSDIKGTLLAQLFDRQLVVLDKAAVSPGNAAIRLKDAAARLRSEKTLKLTALYTGTRYPSAEALKFMHEQELIKVEYVSPRKTMSDGSAFDEYKIMLVAQPGAKPGRTLWVAHFHMPSVDALPRAFTRGHLKTWRQRHMGGREEGGSGYRVHRGELTLEQATGIIPFD
jgi:hypothetical protein